jgi:hypothetical protein
MSEWPKYKSHKIVQAAVIVGFDARDTGGKVCALVDGGDGVPTPFIPNQIGMLEKAEAGDYAMLYSDGYKSISPKAVFEDGYTPCP